MMSDPKFYAGTQIGVVLDAIASIEEIGSIDSVLDALGKTRQDIVGLPADLSMRKVAKLSKAGIRLLKKLGDACLIYPTPGLN